MRYSIGCFTKSCVILIWGLFWRREPSSQSHSRPQTNLASREPARPNSELLRGAPTRNSYPVCSPSPLLGWTGRSIRAWIGFFFCWFSFCKSQQRLTPHYSQMDQGGDKNVVDNSPVSNCDYPVVKKLEKYVDEKAFVRSPFENKDTRSLGMVCDHENNKGGVAEVITQPEKEAIESSIPINVADENPSYGCQTPRESIFDPFAPGPEELACAPKKVIKAPELPSRRQLSFDLGEYPVKRLSYEFDDVEEEDQFLERICKMFIDLIISKQALETTGKDVIDYNSPRNCETPSSEPLLTGIADTCPDAPLRRPLKAVQLSPSICRKLNFDSDSPRCLSVKENK